MHKRKTSLIAIILFLFLFPQFTITAQDKDPEPDRRPAVGLVLSGGGAKGFAYIGLLKVIQEAGLEIDYIGGSSIGALIGGMYAIGYHPDSIVKIIREQNWDDILQDKMDRKYLSYEEKVFGEKYIVSLPIKDKKVAISPSLYTGQEANLLLNYFFSPAYEVTDFSDLQTPFLCIGTDLLDGKAVTLDQGNLAMAVRASMSIPGYFAPTDYEGYYLVDGGVVNNYPVMPVKEMGAQIILGGDVQQGLSKTREELNSLPAILDQIIAYHRVDANKVGYENTDLYVNFKMDFGMMDFNDYDSIIAIGEAVARQHFDQIKALADSLNAIEYRPVKKYETSPLDSIYIHDVHIEGYAKIPMKYFEGIFDGIENSKISMADLQERIRLLYGTKFFEYVIYELKGKAHGADLVIKVKPAAPGYISAGLHYDSDYKASLLINGAFRNVLGKSSKLFADLILGPNWRVRSLYMLDNGSKPGVGAMIDFYSFAFNEYDKDVKVNELTFNNYKGTVFAEQRLKNAYSFSLGFDYEYFQFRQNIAIDTTLDQYSSFSSYGTVFTSIYADTRNTAYFPTSGFNSTLRAEYVMPLSKNWASGLFTNSFIIYLKSDHNIPLSRKLTLQPGVFFGTTIKGDELPPPNHLFAFGGLNPSNYVETQLPFTGLKFLQSFGMHAAVLRVKLQYEVIKKIYLTFRADGGANEQEFGEVWKADNFIVGYGLTASYNSFLGPLELSVMASNINPSPILFLSLGFWF
jgi:NTE family protein